MSSSESNSQEKKLWLKNENPQEKPKKTPEEIKNEINNNIQILNQRMYYAGKYYDAPKK